MGGEIRGLGGQHIELMPRHAFGHAIEAHAHFHARSREFGKDNEIDIFNLANLLDGLGHVIEIGLEIAQFRGHLHDGDDYFGHEGLSRGVFGYWVLGY